MREIYNNYDGSFDSILSTFNQDNKLYINYRCSSNIVQILNNLYNDEKFFQEPYKPCKSKVNGVPLIIDYSSSKAVSFISGKLSNSETVISNPIANLWSVFNLGFFVLPDIIFSSVDCVIPDKVASLMV